MWAAIPCFNKAWAGLRRELAPAPSVFGSRVLPASFGTADLRGGSGCSAAFADVFCDFGTGALLANLSALDLLADLGASELPVASGLLLDRGGSGLLAAAVDGDLFADSCRAVVLSDFWRSGRFKLVWVGATADLVS